MEMAAVMAAAGVQTAAFAFLVEAPEEEAPTGAAGEAMAVDKTFSRMTKIEKRSEPYFLPPAH